MKIQGYDIDDSEMFFKYTKELTRIPITDKLMYNDVGFALLCGYPVVIVQKEEGEY